MTRHRALLVMLVLIAGFAFTQNVTPSNSTSDATTLVERIRSRVSVKSAADLPMKLAAGRYSSSDGLSGDDLYLFPDGTYIYCEWADIEPLTIYDKGRWALANGFVELTSDQDVTWTPRRVERKYLLLRRRTELLLLGTTRALTYFEENAGNDPEMMLFIVAKVRQNKLSNAKTTELREQLMRESWHPDYFSPRQSNSPPSTCRPK